MLVDSRAELSSRLLDETEGFVVFFDGVGDWSRSYALVRAGEAIEVGLDGGCFLGVVFEGGGDSIDGCA